MNSLRWLLLSAVLLSQVQPGPRAFHRVLLLEEKAETSAGVSVGDLNGDGRLDIVLGKGRHWPLFNRVLLNDGHGGFVASDLGTAPDRTYSAALADIDRNGHLDIIVSNDDPDRKLVFKNDGKGRFTEFGTFGDPKWSTRYVTLADLNGDGFPDIVAANRWESPQSPAPSYVCFNNQKGHFPACQALPTQSATSIVAADFDGDGALDLFVPHRDGGQSLVLWNDGKGLFPASTKVGAAKASIRIGAAGDFDGDGRPDLAFIEERVGTFLLFNRGGRQFGEPVKLPGPDRKPYGLAVADLNRDKRADIIVGYVESPGSVYFNTGQGRPFQEVPWNDGKGTVYGLAFADFDGDGWPDIVAARSDAPNGIWFNTKPSEAAAQAASAQENSASNDREREAYKIYSRLLNPPDTTHGENPRYLIAQKARVERWGAGWNPDTCVKPPASHATRFREVLSDFESKRTVEIDLQRKLSIEKPYVLLTDAEVKEFQKQRMTPAPPGRELPAEQFRDVTDLISFSAVYFSQDGNLAMVHMGTWCGGLCARYGWRIFEKSAGREWAELRWPACIVVARHEPGIGSRSNQYPDQP